MVNYSNLKKLKMNKITTTLVLLLAFTTLSYAQLEKIKGNRDVTIKQTYIDSFASLVIKNNFEVKIAYNSKTSVEVEADDNLHEIITINVVDGVLNIGASKRITSKKKLLITINYGDDLNNIELYDDVELRSLTSMELKDVSLKTSGDSRAYLNIKATNFNFSATDKSKSRLNIVADSTIFILSDTSKLDAFVSSKSSAFDIYQRADATIEGDANTSQLRIDNSGNFSGKNYTIQTADVLIESSSDATIQVAKTLNLKASGTTETYVYGQPKFNLEAFSDSAKLQKKEL